METSEPGPRCIGCGQPLEPGAAMCRTCMVPAAGSHLVCLVEDVPARTAVPDVCCCCLSPTAEPVEHRMDAGMRGNATVYVTMTIPWCPGCHWRHWIFEKLSWTALAVSVVAVLWSTSTYGPESPGGWLSLLYLLGGVLAIGVVAGIQIFSIAALPPFRRRGHVGACDAIAVLYTQDAPLKMVLRNRAFARLFCERNQLPAPKEEG